MIKLLTIIALAITPVLVKAQNLISVTPNSGNAGQTLTLTITGSNTHFNQGSGTSLDFGFSQGSSTSIINSMTAVNATTITANITIPQYTFTGDYYVSTMNATDGLLTKSNSFHVNGIAQPTISTVAPNSANAGQTLTLTITGVNTHFNQGSGTSLKFGFNQGSGTIIVNSINSTSATELSANITVPHNTATGDYFVSTYNSIDQTVYLNNGIHIVGTANLQGYVIPTQETISGACDGTGQAIIYGGTLPYHYVFSNGDTNSTASNLCTGMHSVQVIDANNNSLNFNFIVSSLANTTNTNNFIDSTLMGSVYNSAISNCMIDYSLISSVSISNYAILPNNQVAVTWAVTYGANTTNITDTYAFSPASGVYMVALQLYCPTKTIGHYLTSYDQIYYNAELAGIKEKKQSISGIYPNPFREYVMISLDNNQASEIIITDIAGKTVVRKSFNDKLIKIDMNELSAGSYIVTVINNNQVTTKQIVK